MTRIHKNVSFDATASVGEKWMCFFHNAHYHQTDYAKTRRYQETPCSFQSLSHSPRTQAATYP